MRIVIKISTTGADTLKGEFYSIDQSGQPIPASAITRNGSTIKMVFVRIGGRYEGKLSADGNSIIGAWGQGAGMPLNLARVTADTAWTIPEPPLPVKLMPADATPSFEVATIKPSRPDERFSNLFNQSGILNTIAASLSDPIQLAYGLNSQQITGGPSWFESAKFDVTGKPDTPGHANCEQMKMILQKLLVDRFALTFHKEKKELSVYAIAVAKTGSKLAKNDSDPNGSPDYLRGAGSYLVTNSTIAEFASNLQAHVVERPVVDQTELGTARWDLTLKWTPDTAQRPAAAGPDAPPDLFAAFQQQLGLRLQSTKALVDVMVIDHVEKPSPN